MFLAGGLSAMFQFHKVQLKVQGEITEMRSQMFQFHKVQLKESRTLSAHSTARVSIP